MVGFLLDFGVGLLAATVAMLGATVMMLIARIDPHEAFREVEWSTLLSFVGLVVLVVLPMRVGRGRLVAPVLDLDSHPARR